MSRGTEHPCPGCGRTVAYRFPQQYRGGFEGRGGGTGQHSFCERYGTMCFKCAGSGRQLSRAGAKSYKAYQDWAEATLSVPAAEVKVGQFIKPLASAKRYIRVESVELQNHTGTIGRDGNVIPSVTIRGKTPGSGVTCNPEYTVRRAPTNDELRAIFPTLGKGATLVEDAATTPQEA